MKSWDTMSILGFVHPGALVSLQGVLDCQHKPFYIFKWEGCRLNSFFVAKSEIGEVKKDTVAI